MEEKKEYIIEFEYNGKEYSFGNLSYTDFVLDTFINKNWMGMMIEKYLDDNALRHKNGYVSNALLICNGKICYRVNDFSKL